MELIAVKTGIATAATTFYSAVQAQLTLNSVGATVAQTGLAYAYTVVATTAQLAAAAIARMTLALIASLGPAILIGAAIYLIVDFFTAGARAAQAYKESQDAIVATADREIIKQEKKAEAYKTAGESIVSQLVALKQLREEQAKTGVDNSAAQKRASDSAQGIARAAGIELTGDDPHAAAKQFTDAQQAAVDAEKESYDAKIKVAQEKEDEQFKVVKAARQKLADAQSEEDYFFHGKDAGHKKTTTLTDAETSLEKERNEYKKQQDELEALQAKKTELAAIPITNPDDLVQAQQLHTRYKALLEDIARSKTVDKVRKDLASGSGQSDEVLETERLAAAKKKVAEIEDIVNAKNSTGKNAFPDEGQEKLAQDYKKILEEIVDIYAKLETVKLKNVSDFFGGEQDRLKKVGLAFNDAARRRDDAAKPLGEQATPFQAERDKLETEQQFLKDRLERNKDSLDRDQKIANDPAATDDQKLNAAGDAVARRKDSQDDLNRLRDIEVEKVVKLADAEAKVAEERRKSADELARSLGALSDEDKLRVRAQAQFFAENPNKKLSFEDQLATGSADAAITDKFFNSHVAPTPPQKVKPGSFEDNLIKSGAGGLGDLDREQKDIDRARGGLNDNQLRNRAEDRASKDDLAARKLGGQNISDTARSFNPTGASTLDANGHTQNKIDVSVKQDTFQLTELTNQLASSVDAILTRRNNDIIQQVQAILDKDKSLPVQPKLSR